MCKSERSIFLSPKATNTKAWGGAASAKSQERPRFDPALKGTNRVVRRLQRRECLDALTWGSIRSLIAPQALMLVAVGDKNAAS